MNSPLTSASSLLSALNVLAQTFKENSAPTTSSAEIIAVAAVIVGITLLAMAVYMVRNGVRKVRAKATTANQTLFSRQSRLHDVEEGMVLRDQWERERYIRHQQRRCGDSPWRYNDHDVVTTIPAPVTAPDHWWSTLTSNPRDRRHQSAGEGKGEELELGYVLHRCTAHVNHDQYSDIERACRSASSSSAATAAIDNAVASTSASSAPATATTATTLPSSASSTSRGSKITFVVPPRSVPRDGLNGPVVSLAA